MEEQAFSIILLIFIGGVIILGVLYVVLMFLCTIFPTFHKRLFKWGIIRVGKNDRCEICGMETKDCLAINGTKYKPLCRVHLIQEFRREFLNFLNKFVVFHPEQNRDFCQSMYPYYPLKDMVGVFNFDKKAFEKIEQAISSIQGNCSECENQALIKYYPKGLLQWDEGYGPKLEDISIENGVLLCKQCALDKIVPDLEQNPANFGDGLLVPYDGEGVYVNTYL